MPHIYKTGGFLALAAVLAAGVAPPPAPAARRSSSARPRPAVSRVSPVRVAPLPIELGPGEEDLVEIRLANPSGRPTVGTLRLTAKPGITLSQSEWDGPLPPWGAKLYIRMKAGPNVEPGPYPIRAVYFVDRAGDYQTTLPVRVIVPIKVDVIPDYEGSAVRVRVRNLLSRRTERGKVELRNPDRFLEDRVSALLPAIPPGRTGEVSIPVVRGGIAGGETYRFDVSVSTWAGYRTNFTRHLKFYD